tara:strand:- start:23 stop:355 length:333 start_codon:yes stop_codon:yes gene_type:complete
MILKLKINFITIYYKMNCRGKGPAVCRSLVGCKYASGKKRNYCRKSNRGKAKPKSKCNRKGPAVCRSLSGCKYVSGKKRNYCRAVKSKKNNMNGGRRTKRTRRTKRSNRK